MSRATRRRTERAVRALPWTISGFGLLSTAFFVGWCLWFRSVLDATGVAVSFATIATPSLALVWAGHWLARSDLGAERYGRICQWCLGGATVSLAVNGLVIAFFPWYNLAGNVAWAHWSLNVGAAVGLLVGYVEARAIQREVEAAAAAVRAEQLEEDRELLAYLNDLLRHEVLNSAQIISGHASLLLEEADDSTRGSLEAIDRESEALTDVIDDIRAMLNATETSEVRAVVDLEDVLRDELARLEGQFDDVEIDAEIPEDVRVEGNEGIRWIFANVLENAVEHNDGDRPRVEVTVATTPETVAVRIADDGPGIPPAVRETLFDRRTENHGLGLYLVRILATRYGGSVELEETGPDGSTFTVTLTRADDGRSNDSAARGRNRTESEPPATDAGSPTAPETTGDAGTGTDSESASRDERTESEPNERTETESNERTETNAESEPSDHAAGRS